MESFERGDFVFRQGARGDLGSEHRQIRATQTGAQKAKFKWLRLIRVIQSLEVSPAWQSFPHQPFGRSAGETSTGPFVGQAR